MLRGEEGGVSRISQLISQSGNGISTSTGSSWTHRVQEGHLGLEEERSHRIRARRLWLRCCGAPVATLPPRLAAMSQHMQVHGAALFTGGSGNPVSVGGAVTSGAPRLRGRGPAPPQTSAGGARADEMCSVYKHATWPASCSLKPSRCTKRPLPPPEHVPAQGPGCGTRCGSSVMGLVTSLPSRTLGVRGSENSQGDQLPGAGRSPYVPIPLFLCVCVDPQTVPSAHTVHLRTN